MKYCGGCDPGFDRVGYFQEIQNAAGDLIEWVTLDDPGFECVLVISGCDTACPEENMVTDGLSKNRNRSGTIKVIPQKLSKVF